MGCDTASQLPQYVHILAVRRPGLGVGPHEMTNIPLTGFFTVKQFANAVVNAPRKRYNRPGVGGKIASELQQIEQRCVAAYLLLRQTKGAPVCPFAWDWTMNIERCSYVVYHGTDIRKTQVTQIAFKRPYRIGQYAGKNRTSPL